MIIRKRKFKKLIAKAGNYKVTKPQFIKLYKEYKKAYKGLKAQKMVIRTDAQIDALNNLRNQEKQLASKRLQGTRRSIREVYLSSKLGSYMFTRAMVKAEFKARHNEIASKHFNTDQLA